MKLRTKRHIRFASRNLDGKIVARTYLYTIQVRRFFFLWQDLGFEVDYLCRIGHTADDIINQEEVVISDQEESIFSCEEDALAVIEDIKSNPNKYIEFD